MGFFEEIKKYDIILASKSPRRQSLLREADISFKVVMPDFDEEINRIDEPEDIVLKLCRSKASNQIKAVDKKNTILITADTVVCYKGEILNKPNNEDEAINMLKKLSGGMHNVYTGVCLKTQNKERSFYEKTSVLFEKLTRDEIEYYCKRFKPFDKAGGYGIQEWIGLIGVKRIEGSYHNVIGLPVARLFKELRRFIKE